MQWREIVAIVFLTTLYIFADAFVDAHPQPQSIKALVRTVGFYVLYGIFGALNFSAYYLLRDMLPKGTPWFAIALASTFSCVTVLQSLSFKVGDQKLLDVGKFVESYRKTVFQQATEKHAELQHAQTKRLADQLAEIYKEDREQLISDLFSVASKFGKEKETNDEIEKYIQEEEALAMRTRSTFERKLAGRIAATDPVAARVFLKRKKKKNMRATGGV